MLAGLAIYEPKTFKSLVEIAVRRQTAEPDPDWWKLIPEESQQTDYDDNFRENQETLKLRLNQDSLERTQVDIPNYCPK